MDRPATVTVPEPHLPRARLGGTTQPSDTSVWDDPVPAESTATSTDDQAFDDAMPDLDDVFVDDAPADVLAETEPEMDVPADLGVMPQPAIAADLTPTLPVVTPPVATPALAPADAPATGAAASVFDVPVTADAAPAPVSAPPPTPAVAHMPTPTRPQPVLAPQDDTERTAPATVRAVPKATPRRRRSATARHLVAALILLVVVAGAGWWFTNRSAIPADLTSPVAEAATPEAPEAPEAAVADDPPAEPAESVEPPAEAAAPVVEPEVVEPEVVQPAAAEPEVVEPEVMQPEVVEPEPAEPTVDEAIVEEPAAEQPTEAPAEAPVETPVEDAAADEPAAAPVVVAPVDGRRVELTTRYEPCRFGNDCLIVGFELFEFDTLPDTFVCEFASGSRFEFNFSKTTVRTACMTGASGDSITIEVDGVRSETAVHR